MLMQFNLRTKALSTGVAGELMRVFLVMKFQVVFICSRIITDVTEKYFLLCMSLLVLNHVL
jgi:hypothetical protein